MQPTNEQVAALCIAVEREMKLAVKEATEGSVWTAKLHAHTAREFAKCAGSRLLMDMCLMYSLQLDVQVKAVW